jgi:hypothetical protein
VPRRAATVAVIGSMAALGGAGNAVAQPTHPSQAGPRAQPRRADPRPAGELALLGLVFSGLAAAAPAIARPILSGGVADGTITPAQADRFLAGLASVKAAEEGGPSAGPGQAAVPAQAPPTPAAQALFQRALAAIRAELPVVAAPLLGAAVADGSITEAQASRLRGRFAGGPRLGFGLVLRGARAIGATRLP